jgi:hypothetical protein
MKNTSSMKLYLAIAGLTLVLVVGGCAMAPKGERYVVAPLGTTFTSAYTNTDRYGSRTSEATTKITERMWDGKRVTAFVSPTMTLLVTADGAWPAILTPDDKPIFSWDPPIGYDFPLEVGKTWTKSYRITIHAISQTFPFDNTVKVEAYEDVTVPAGTFKVFKISGSDTLGNESVTWFSPELGFVIKRIERRTAMNPFGPGTQESELISLNMMK